MMDISNVNEAWEIVGGAVLNDGTVIRVYADTKPRYYRSWMFDDVIREAIRDLRQQNADLK